MPPYNTSSQVGWKAFFGLLALLNGISVTLLFRTYDAVQEGTKINVLQDYKIDEVIIPAIEELRYHRVTPPNYLAPAKQDPSSP
jgi:hypothetical protein